MRILPLRSRLGFSSMSSHITQALPQLKRFTEAQVMDVVSNSTSNIDMVTKRFESLVAQGRTFVRASYGHSISIVRFPDV